MSEKRLRFVLVALVAQICGALPPSHGQVPGQVPGQIPDQEASRSAADALKGTFKAYAGDPSGGRVSQFSGLPVPRYSSLKYAEVNGRAGPSADYPVSWSYSRQGLPVVIVRESEDWRKIRDPQGDEVWVHARMLAGDRTAITTEEGAIRRQPKGRSQAIARYAAGAVLTLESCGGDWCRVTSNGKKGFAPRAQLWGADDLAGAR